MITRWIYIKAVILMTLVFAIVYVASENNGSAFAEMIQLKSGKIIQGNIVAESDDKIKVLTETGTYAIPKKSIAMQGETLERQADTEAGLDKEQIMNKLERTLSQFNLSPAQKDALAIKRSMVLGTTEQTDVLFQKALERFPRSNGMRADYIAFLIDQRDYVHAKEICDRSVIDFPTQPEFKIFQKAILKFQSAKSESEIQSIQEELGLELMNMFMNEINNVLPLRR